MLSSTHHLLTSSGVRLRKNPSQFLKRIIKASQESIEEIVKALSKKMFTLDDKTRKMRIADAVLFNKSKVTLLTSVYQSVLPIFKMYVMLLQRDKPMTYSISSCPTS